MDNSHKFKDDTFSYALKVWLTGVLVPSMLWSIGGIGFFFLAGIYSAVFSIPSGLVFWEAVRLINRQTWGVQAKKTVLCLISIVLTGLAFSLMGLATGENPLDIFSAFGTWPTIQFAYAAVICFAVQCFDLLDRNPEIPEEIIDTHTVTPTDHLHDTND